MDSNLFSIVIPTMWKSKRIHRLLTDLIDCPYVGEIILIDNSNEFKSHYSEVPNKVKLVVPETNLFVNPSWNLGVSLSTYDNIALCNDDINFSTHVFKYLAPNLKEWGIIGQSESNYFKDEEEQVEGNLRIDRTPKIGYAWGCLILFHKSNFVKIPECLKIGYGDNWLIDNCKSYNLYNLFIEYDDHSTTVKTKQFKNVFKDMIDVDYHEYLKLKNANIKKILVTSAGMGGVHDIKSVWVPQNFPGYQIDFKRYDDTNYPSRKGSLHPRLKAKMFRMLAWEEYPDYDYYVWTDSTIHIVKSKALEYAINSLGTADICLFHHPERTTVKQEVDYVEHQMAIGNKYMISRYEGERMRDQLNHYYKDESYVDDLLVATGCFIYSKRLVENRNYNLMKEWFYHNAYWSIQDQISFPYLLKKFQVDYNWFDTGIYDNPFFRFDMKIYGTQQQ